MQAKYLMLISFAWLLLTSARHVTSEKYETQNTEYTALVIEQDIADTSKWQHVFLNFLYPWEEAGLTVPSYSQSLEYTNRVITFQQVLDEKKTKEFISSGRLHQLMKEAGVSDSPKISIIHVEYDNNVIMQQERLFMSLQVNDYKVWKQAFMDTQKGRLKYGLIDRLIAYDTLYPQKVTVYLGITDMKKAHAFIKSEQYKNYLTQAGITDTKMSWYKWVNYIGWFYSKP